MITARQEALLTAHDRLKARTDELQREHDTISLKPFDLLEHRIHGERLREHHAQLRAHTARLTHVGIFPPKPDLN